MPSGRILLMIFLGNPVYAASTARSCAQALDRIANNARIWSLDPDVTKRISQTLALQNVPLPERLNIAYGHMQEAMLKQLPFEDANEIRSDLKEHTQIGDSEFLGRTGYLNAGAYPRRPERKGMEHIYGSAGKHHSISLSIPQALMNTPVELLTKIHELQHLIHFQKEFGPKSPITDADAARAMPIKNEISIETDAIGMEWEIARLIPDAMAEHTLRIIEAQKLNRPQIVAAPLAYRKLPKKRFIEAVLKARDRTTFCLWLKRIKGWFKDDL